MPLGLSVDMCPNTPIMVTGTTETTAVTTITRSSNVTNVA